MTVVLHHETLGNILGKKNAEGDIAQYLGLKYATLEDRFAEPVLASSLSYRRNCANDTSEGSLYDATTLGPAVASSPAALALEYQLIQKEFPVIADGHASSPQQSDLEGLNLNITVPKLEELGREGLLPVFVFIHGGGFMGGSATYPHYDCTEIVRRSMERGRPMIAVGLNYRLGIPGFLTSAELQSAGYKSNNGLRDQRTALRWLKQHISGFGGDPENMTVAGESAGASSVSFLLQSQEKLCSRIMLMSGSPLLMRPVSPETAEHFYHSAITTLGLADLSAEERINALLAMPIADLIEKIGPTVPALPVTDDEIIIGTPSFASLSDSSATSFPTPGNHWIDGVMLGDCAFDGMILSLNLHHRKPSIGASFSKTLHSHLSPDLATRILQIYSLDSANNANDDDDDEEAFQSVLEFANDVAFYAPTLAYSRAFSSAQRKSPIYMYRFNELNPWDGPWKGTSTHILDVVFLFQNYNSLLPSLQRKTAVAFADGLIDFVNAREPWERWTQEARMAMVFEGGEAEVKRDDDMEAVGRRRAFVEVCEEVGWDVVDACWMAFLMG